MITRRDRIAMVIREALHDRERAALPPTPGEIADRLMPWMQPAGNVREWTRMAQQVNAVRGILAEHDAGKLWSSQAVERIREALAEESA